MNISFKPDCHAFVLNFVSDICQLNHLVWFLECISDLKILLFYSRHEFSLYEHLGARKAYISYIRVQTP